MINTDDFVKRLEAIFDYYSLTASSFADKINVQRSSISHLLSGRNKPSLDFILKVIDSFPDVELLWLLNGKGSFPNGEDSNFVKTISPPIQKIELENEIKSQELFSDNTMHTSQMEKNGVFEKRDYNFLNNEVLKTSNNGSNENSDIERIVVFYSDGTFKSYLQNKHN